MGKGSVVLLLLVCLFAVQSVRAVQSSTLPTFDDLKSLYDQGKYSTVLQKMQPILALNNGPAAEAYDKVEIQMLRGETLLRITQQQAAVIAFGEAVKASAEPITSGKKLKPRMQEQVALARATLVLVKRSPALEYRPKPLSPTDKPAGTSLLDASKRQVAFEVLLAELKREVVPKSDAAATGKSISDIMGAVDALIDFEAVEFVVEKSTSKGDGMLAKLSDRAESLMSPEVDRMYKAAKAIDGRAHKKTEARFSDGNGNVTVWHGLRGLHPDETRDLETMIDTLAKVVYVSQDFERIADKDTSTKFKSVEDRAMKAGKEAYKTLHDNYRDTSRIEGTGPN